MTRAMKGIDIRGDIHYCTMLHHIPKSSKLNHMPFQYSPYLYP